MVVGVWNVLHVRKPIRLVADDENFSQVRKILHQAPQRKPEFVVVPFATGAQRINRVDRGQRFDGQAEKRAFFGQWGIHQELATGCHALHHAANTVAVEGRTDLLDGRRTVSHNKTCDLVGQLRRLSFDPHASFADDD